MNSGLIKTFRVLTGVTHLIILADMDPHSAAFACAWINRLAQNDIQKVTFRWCHNGDFNDMLMNGDQVRELTYTRKAVA